MSNKNYKMPLFQQTYMVAYFYLNHPVCSCNQCNLWTLFLIS